MCKKIFSLVFSRAPFLMQQVLLKPGKIETAVIADFEELDAGRIELGGKPLNIVAGT
jgi:hypothetical protein